ncbi:MAG TPA: monofunctional biosynthetic peptidoglycan transglycosylase [Woeseiaceae bacterium]|nr:monofunctional biosynthetic peptidoglycan transglycosylase [Woeseiaceae bacterium]
MRHRKHRSRLCKALVGTAAVVAAFIVTSVALVLPLRFTTPATTAFILQDDSGRVPVARAWLPWPQLGTRLPLAVVAAEDQKFGTHFGFDLESIRQSVADFSDGESLRGASTITQQLAKNLFLWPGRSFVRKGLEAWFTVVLESCLPKRRILELYLNVVEFGPGIYGAAAASRHYFGREPGRLNAAQAALLAAVLPNPARLDAARPSRYLRERQRWILAQMARLERDGWLATID